MKDFKEMEFKYMAYNKKADENYRKKIDRMAIKYGISELNESERLRAYLAQTGQSANSYIKALIKRDLDSKNVPYADMTEPQQPTEKSDAEMLPWEND